MSKKNEEISSLNENKIIDNTERERSNLYKLSELLRESKDGKLLLELACSIIAEFFTYSNFVNIRIKYGKYRFSRDNNNFVKTKWKLERSFQTIYQNKGVVEVYYTKEFPIADKGAFFNYEINYFKKATTLITSYINKLEASLEIDRKK